MAPIIAALIPILGNVFDKMFPDPKTAAAAKLQVMELAQRGELANLEADVKLAAGQMEINKVEAASTSFWVAGARPAIMWVCAAAFAFKFIGGPLLVMLASLFGYTITLPTFDYSEMNTLLFGMLGLSASRTVEKIKGISK